MSSAAATQIESLQGVGATRAKHLQELGLRTLDDLLEYFPRSYQYESPERKIRELVSDQIQTVRGTVIAVDYIPRPRSRFEATLEDDTAKLAVVWFNGAYLRKLIHPGQLIRGRGRVKFFRGIPQMANPKWQEIDEQADRVEAATFRSIPLRSNFPATRSRGSFTTISTKRCKA
jgi:ATP-dependent DNA helicase RecG